MSSARHTLSRSRDLGSFRIHALDGGSQLLDGGAMFGVVPKPLWQKRISADERNRIPLSLRALLIETGDELVLVETGIGNKESQKFRDIYGVENEAVAEFGGADRLQSAILELGFALDDISIVIDTHLHFDHAGGNTWRDEEGEVHPSFPRATYYVQRGEWDYAHWDNVRTRASYLPHNYHPVHDRGMFELVDGDRTIVPGVEVVCTPGHTPHHQSVLIRDGDQTACYMADVIPTMSHLDLPWIMGYDVEPLVTLESKRKLLTRASEENWLLVSTHDPVRAWGRASFDGSRVEFTPED